MKNDLIKIEKVKKTVTAEKTVKSSEDEQQSANLSDVLLTFSKKE